jgi:hypothetical protein
MGEEQNSAEQLYDPSKIALYSALLNMGVAGAKGVLAWLSGSSALLADTIHGFSDTFASILVLVGIWLSKRKSEAFPWGLYKVENFVALLSAGFIFFAGYEMVHYVFRKGRPLTLAYLYPSVFGLLAMILIIVILRYEARRAKVLNSPSLFRRLHWYSVSSVTRPFSLVARISCDRPAELRHGGVHREVGGLFGKTRATLSTPPLIQRLYIESEIIQRHKSRSVPYRQKLADSFSFSELVFIKIFQAHRQ